MSNEPGLTRSTKPVMTKAQAMAAAEKLKKERKKSSHTFDTEITKNEWEVARFKMAAEQIQVKSRCLVSF